MLGQEVFADDYRGEVAVFRGEFRASDGSGRAGTFLRVAAGRDVPRPLTEGAVVADPANNLVTVAGGCAWTGYEVTARVPEDSDELVFGMFLAGPGRLELRNPEFVRG
jgi:hypothetical protein